MEESSTRSQLKHNFQISGPALLCTTTTGTLTEFSEMSGRGLPLPAWRTSGWIKGEAVETVAIANYIATVRATQHSSLSCGLVWHSFAKQTPGKAVPLCYHKLVHWLLVHWATATREKDFQEQQQLSEATFGMLENKAYFNSLTCLKSSVYFHV